MKWLKWHHRFVTHNGPIRWAPLEPDADDEDIRKLVIGFRQQHANAMHYRGVGSEVVADAPRWVIEHTLQIAMEQFLAAERAVKRYDELLPLAIDCRQCGSALARGDGPTELHAHCPLCGREILRATLPFWLLPDHEQAIALLQSLVEEGPQCVLRGRSGLGQWHAHLSALGLICLTTTTRPYEQLATATKLGVDEWAKHKARKEIALAEPAQHTLDKSSTIDAK